MIPFIWGFPGGFSDSSAGTESTCSAGDPGSIPGLGRSTREGIGCPLQYSWASLVTQLVKNLPTVWESWVRSLGWEDPLDKGKTNHSNSPWGHKELDTTEQLSCHSQVALVVKNLPANAGDIRDVG